MGLLAVQCVMPCPHPPRPPCALSKLWPNNTAPSAGYPATAIGLGYIDNKQTEPVNLQEVDLKVVSKADCNLAFANWFSSKKGKLYNKLKSLFRVNVNGGITDTMICASNPGPTPLPDNTLPKKDACQGDSGGPLFYKGATWAADLVFGATSFGVECGQIPGVWANVPNYNTWIQTQINSLNSTINEYAVRITLNGARQAAARAQGACTPAPTTTLTARIVASCARADVATKAPVSRALNLDQQLRAAQFISYLLGKKDQNGNPNFWNADFYVRFGSKPAKRAGAAPHRPPNLPRSQYMRSAILRIGYSSGSNFAAVSAALLWLARVAASFSPPSPRPLRAAANCQVGRAAGRPQERHAQGLRQCAHTDHEPPDVQHALAGHDLRREHRNYRRFRRHQALQPLQRRRARVLDGPLHPPPPVNAAQARATVLPQSPLLLRLLLRAVSLSGQPWSLPAAAPRAVVRRAPCTPPL